MGVGTNVIRAIWDQVGLGRSPGARRTSMLSAVVSQGSRTVPAAASGGGVALYRFVRGLQIHRRIPMIIITTSCARGDTICPRPSPLPVGALAPRAPASRRIVAVVSHAQYVFTATAAPASRVKAAVSKAAW